MDQRVCGLFGVGSAIFIPARRWGPTIPIGFDFPEFNLSAFLAPANLPALLLSLSVREPARIVVFALNSRRHQMDCIAAPVWTISGRVHGHSRRTDSRLPGFLPRRHTVFQHLDDAVRDFLPEITLFRDRGAGSARFRG